MSAIFGIINKNGEPVDKNMIAKMQASLLHLAVDGKSVYSEANMAFGHHKLNVHRRQAQEKQPFIWEDYVITCDARIDNIGDLFHKLGIVPSPQIYTDPFIILNAFKKWGNDCLDHLEGEFCFAIWNRLTKVFFAASDQIGFRSFYYYDSQDIFVFSSEIKAIELIKSEPLALDEQLFSFSPKVQVYSYDKNIKYLQASTSIEIAGGKKRIEQYWKAQRNRSHYKNIEWHEEAFRLLARKIELQIDSDYPVGILLSGGLDSSLLTIIACRLLKKQNKKLHAFCSVLPDRSGNMNNDERIYIESLKREFDNLEVHYVTVPDNEGYYSNLEETFIKAERPIIMLHYVDSALYKAAQKLNVRTLLSGFGGDETISSKGSGVILHYIKTFRFLKASRLFYKKYKAENASLTNQLKSEILRHLTLYQTISSLIHSNSTNKSLIPFNKKRIKEANVYVTMNQVKSTIHSINVGYTGYVLFSNKKFARTFNLEFSAPIYDRSVLELSINMPQDLFLQNGVKRSFMKKLLKDIAPEEIISRNDKGHYSPDYKDRILKFDNGRYHQILADKIILEQISGCDFDKLSKLIESYKIANEKNIDQYNLDALYIPYSIITAEFILWLFKKQNAYDLEQ